MDGVAEDFLGHGLHEELPRGALEALGVLVEAEGLDAAVGPLEDLEPLEDLLAVVQTGRGHVEADGLVRGELALRPQPFLNQ